MQSHCIQHHTVLSGARMSTLQKSNLPVRRWGHSPRNNNGLTCVLCHAVVCKLQHMAKEVVRTNKAVSQIVTHKAQLMSINHALVEQLAMLRVSHVRAECVSAIACVLDLAWT